MTIQQDTLESMTFWRGGYDRNKREYYALIIPPGLDVEPISFSPGATSQNELAVKVQERYGLEAVQVVPYRFHRVVQRRKTHRQEMVELLSYHSLEGDDLRASVVYGSSGRPLSTSDIRPLVAIYGAISIAADKAQDGYYSYIVVPQFLPEEQENEYELDFISRPISMKRGV